MAKYILIKQIDDLSGFTIPNTNAGAGEYYEIFTGSGGGGVGTVTDVSVVSANGFAGTVANATSSPDITLTTSISGVLKGNGTAISAASQGVDYYAPGGTDVAVADGGTGASTAGGARTNLGLVIGTDVQAYDADLTTWAGLTPSAFFQTLVDDTDAATSRTTLGLVAGGAGDIWVEKAGDTMTGALIANDHGTASTDEVINICYGTSATPPAANTTTEGALYIQYVA